MILSLQKLRPTLVRNLSAVSVHKIGQIAGLVLTVALVPRLFGAEMYGRFAFVLSLSYLGQILGDFGTLDVFGRFVPGMSFAEARQLYMRHLAFKIVVGFVCGVLITGPALWLVGWMRPWWAGVIGLGVALHIIAWVPYQFALGLNRVGTWMSEQAWRQWVLLGLLLALLPALGLSGALLALLVMELLFLGLGLWWVQAYWHRPALQLDWPFLQPYLRFGMAFFLANLLTVALYRSGPLLIESLTNNSAETGYFNLALGLFLLAYVTMSQFAQSLIPQLSNFYSTGQIQQMQHWLQNLARTGWFIGWLGVFSVWLLADWAVPLLFGPTFAPAASALKWMTLAMPLVALLWTGNIIATVAGRGRIKFAASLIALLIFVAGTVWLSPGYGATGASLVLVIAAAVSVVVLRVGLSSLFEIGWWLFISTGLVGCLMLVGLVMVAGSAYQE